MLSSKELKRYNRHIILPQIGLEGQQKLQAAKVAVIGAGGLGCPVLQYLTAAGVGTIGIIDYDTVDESNLQRQVLFDQTNVGKPKAEMAAQKLALQNPYVKFDVHTTQLSKDNALSILNDYDIVVDGSDNFPTRYLVNDACVILDKPLVFGSIFRFEGQVAVLNLTSPNGDKGPTYRCLFPEPPAPGEVPGCSEAGVLGVLPGMVGTMQANEVIKIITGIGQPLSGKLLMLDALTMQTQVLTFVRNAEATVITALNHDYEAFCDPSPAKPFAETPSITVLDLQAKMQAGEDFVLLDVRENYEYEICNLGGLQIPMNQIPQLYDRIPPDKPVVVMCHHGVRSAMVIDFLSQSYGYNNLYNLHGGIHAWAVQVDTEMEQY